MTSISSPLFEEGLQPLLDCFGTKECEVLRHLGAHIPEFPEKVQRELHSAVTKASKSIPPLVRSIEASPIVPDLECLGSRERNAETLIDTLCRKNWQPVELTMPTGALVGRALVFARVNFLKTLNYSLEAAEGELASRLRASLQGLIDDAIFSKLAEVLLTAAVSNPRNSHATRRTAARRLLRLWTNLVRQPVAGFPTALLSAWRARCKVRAIYGTLFGSEELLSLIREECEPDFVRFFTREQVTSDQTEAFREFLFALPYEELQHLQQHMREHSIPVLSREQVHGIVGKTLRPPEPGPPSAEEVFASYWRRRIRAEYRSLSSSPGPHKTAEGYIMESLLEEQAAEQG